MERIRVHGNTVQTAILFISGIQAKQYIGYV